MFRTSDAFRAVYAVQLGEDIWVVHCLSEEICTGIKTPETEIELVKDRFKSKGSRRGGCPFLVHRICGASISLMKTTVA